MKKITLLLAGITLVTAGLQAQTADDIINKCADALGGRKKLADIKSIYMEGQINAQGTQIPIKFWRVIGKSYRNEVTVNGMTQYTIIRTDSGWANNPFMGHNDAEPMTADEVKSSQSELESEAGLLLNYKEKGYRITLQGKDDVDGTDAYKIEEKITDSLTQTYYIDPDTYYIIRIHIKATADGKAVEQDIDLSNYQKTADGYTFAMTMTANGGEIKLTTVKVNSDIDSKLFRPAK